MYVLGNMLLLFSDCCLFLSLCSLLQWYMCWGNCLSFGEEGRRGGLCLYHDSGCIGTLPWSWSWWEFYLPKFIFGYIYEEITLLGTRSRTLQVKEQLHAYFPDYWHCVSDSNCWIVTWLLHCIICILSCNLILTLETHDDDHASVTIFIEIMLVLSRIVEPTICHNSAHELRFYHDILYVL